jgi:hypothetical protein
MRRLAAGLPPVLAVLLLAGCASTPARRIAQHPDVFAAFPPEVQEQVRRGEVEPGFTRDMVFLALGRPARVLHRREAAGVREVWSYSGTGYSREMVPVRRTYGWRDRKGRGRVTEMTHFEMVDMPFEVESARVEFAADGRAAEVIRMRTGD